MKAIRRVIYDVAVLTVAHVILNAFSQITLLKYVIWRITLCVYKTNKEHASLLDNLGLER